MSSLNYLFIFYSLGLVTPSLFPNAYSQDLSFSIGDNISVISDKAYRRTEDNLFEAVGNVIINHETNSIYGEKATLNFVTGETQVMGNVRYVSPEMTMYGSHITYQIETGHLQLQNARIISDNYVVFGREIIQDETGEIYAQDAEYTTCRDCPESWSIMGEEVWVTLNEYIRIKNAYIKARGVPIMYVPYIVLPIKKERETGLLFPSISFRQTEGVRIQQPFFWAIDDHRDLTLTPSFYGKRGSGTDLEYRHILGERRWFEFNSTMAYDRIYLADQPERSGLDPSGTNTLRHFSEYEHHYQFSHNLSHHLKFDSMWDMDMVRDYDFLIEEDRFTGSEIGGKGHFDYRRSWYHLSVESYFSRNFLTPDPRDFDDDYVQILPKISLNTSPFTLIRSDVPGFQRWSFDLKSDYTIFRQNKVNEGQYIRNAQRLNIAPTLDIDLFNIGFVAVNTKTDFDLQYYHFPEEERERSFLKHASVQTTQLSLDLERTFGIAYRERLRSDQVERPQYDQYSQMSFISGGDLIGQLPRFDRRHSDEQVLVEERAYRHLQQFRLRHYYLIDEKTRGSQSFLNQIDTDQGQFDQIDALRRNEHLRTASSRTQLPLSNTIELQWNNSLIRKTARDFDPNQDNRFLSDNFEYGRIAHFNVSQGFDFESDSEDIKERLTRLYVNTGFNIGRTSFWAQEYYFYDTNDQLFTVGLRQRFNDAFIGMSLIYNSFARPSDKRFSIDGAIRATDVIDLRMTYDYDLEDRQEVMSRYGVTYAPSNDCWMIDLSYERSQVEKRIAFNFSINFNDPHFRALRGF